MPKGVLRFPKILRCAVCSSAYEWTNTGKPSPWCAVCRPKELKKAAVVKTAAWQSRNGQKVLRYRKERARRTNRHKRYGLPEAEFDRLAEAQGYRCAICERHVERLHVDHSHATGDIRGLLCFHCNAGLGHFRDDPALLERAGAYLQRVGTSPAIARSRLGLG